MKVLIVLAALCFAFASAQNTTYDFPGEIHCAGIVPPSECFEGVYETSDIGEYCGFCVTDDTEYIYYRCGSDASCDYQLTQNPPYGICREVVIREIRDSCDPSDRWEVCHQDNYDVSCIENGADADVCGGVRVYGPGQACGTDTEILNNGDGCADSNCVDGTCQGAASGESCASLHCRSGLYCNDNDVCTSRIAIGGTCNFDGVEDNDETDGDNHGCAANADCIDGICIEYYSVPEGGKCGVVDGYYNHHVCEQDLLCSYESDSAYNCIALDEGNPCSVSSNNCGDYYECVCNYKDGTGVCIGEQNRIGDALRAAYRCLVEHSCYFSLDWFIVGCVEEECGSEVEDVVKEVHSAANAVGRLTGVPTEDSASLVVISTVLVAACAAIALVL